jgi:hypothetical protein
MAFYRRKCLQIYCMCKRQISAMKVKEVTLNFTLEQAMKAQRGADAQHYSSFNLDTRWGWVVKAMARLLCPWEDTIPIVQQAGWAPRLVWMGSENLALMRIRSPHHPACSKSLY